MGKPAGVGRRRDRSGCSEREQHDGQVARSEHHQCQAALDARQHEKSDPDRRSRAYQPIRRRPDRCAWEQVQAQNVARRARMRDHPQRCCGQHHRDDDSDDHIDPDPRADSTLTGATRVEPRDGGVDQHKDDRPVHECPGRVHRTHVAADGRRRAGSRVAAVALEGCGAQRRQAEEEEREPGAALRGAHPTRERAGGGKQLMGRGQRGHRLVCHEASFALQTIFRNRSLGTTRNVATAVGAEVSAHPPTVFHAWPRHPQLGIMWVILVKVLRCRS